MEKMYQINQVRAVCGSVLLLFLATSLGPAVAPASAAVAATSAQQLCSPHDSELCELRCAGHQRECYQACNKRRRMCLENAWNQARVCKARCGQLDSRSSQTECRRRCISEVLAKARKRCRVGQPVCRRLCGPESCDDLCNYHLPRFQHDSQPGAALSGALSQKPLSPPAMTPDAAGPVDAGPVDYCDPTGDRECRADCAKGMRRCLSAVKHRGRQCLQACRGLHGEERVTCARDCSVAARKGLKRCRARFGGCIDGCAG